MERGGGGGGLGVLLDFKKYFSTKSSPVSNFQTNYDEIFFDILDEMKFDDLTPFQ